jgi:hypothetical protein
VKVVGVFVRFRAHQCGGKTPYLQERCLIYGKTIPALGRAI